MLDFAGGAGSTKVAVGGAHGEEGLVQEQEQGTAGCVQWPGREKGKDTERVGAEGTGGGFFGVKQAGPPGGRLGMPGGAPGLRPTGQRSADQGPRPAKPRPVQRLVLHGPEAKDGLYIRQWLLKENQSQNIL